MKILNINSTPPSARESLLGRKIQIEITGLDFAILRALVGSATTPDITVLSKHLQIMHDIFRIAIPPEEYAESMHLVNYATSARLTYNP